MAGAQDPRVGVRQDVYQLAILETAEIDALERGEAVVKLQRVKDKRQIAVIGVVRLEKAPQLSIDEFRDSLSQRNNKTLLGGGTFSSPPQIDDLKTLDIDDRDIDAIGKCMPGACSVKLSAAMLKRLQAAIDWDAADHKEQAADRFRQILVDYVRDYTTRGDAALVEFVDQRVPFRLMDEYGVLLDESFFLKKLAPELSGHLRQFPRSRLAGVEDTIDWSNVNFGLKPFITITHTAGYAVRDSSGLRLLIAAKQLYASHYIDASLALSIFLQTGEADEARSYLIFTNISRSDALGGILGGVTRPVVEKEATDRLRELLRQAKQRVETKGRPQSLPAGSIDDESLLSSFARFSRSGPVQVLAIIALVAGLALLVRRLRA